jgi:hypothetical protein
VDHDDGVSDAVNLKVKSDGPSNAIVSLKWPAIAPISVHSLKRTLHLPEDSPEGTRRTFQIGLLDGPSGRVLKRGRLTNSGEFNFSGVEPGFYFIQLQQITPPSESGGPIQGLIAVAVDPNAQRDHLDLDLEWTSCGLTYTDLEKCTTTDVQMKQLAGEVVDSTGAGLPDAEVLLFDAGDEPHLVTRLATDNKGKFASHSSLSGAYRLQVRKNGFTALRVTTNIGPAAELKSAQPLKIRLGLSGACSAVIP